MENELKRLIEKMPKNYYVCGKALWCGDVCQEIDHIDNDLNKPLDLIPAFKKMVKKLDLSTT
jgi:hypothetical protein